MHLERCISLLLTRDLLQLFDLVDLPSPRRAVLWFVFIFWWELFVHVELFISVLFTRELLQLLDSLELPRGRGAVLWRVRAQSAATAAAVPTVVFWWQRFGLEGGRARSDEQVPRTAPRTSFDMGQLSGATGAKLGKQVRLRAFLNGQWGEPLGWLWRLQWCFGRNQLVR